MAYISLAKIDAVRKAVKELENEGYIIRSRERDEHGKLRGTEYIIREKPISDLPTLEKPTLDNPTLEKPMLKKPTLENPREININNKLNINKLNTDLSNTHSIPFDSDSYTDTRESNGI